MAERKVLTKYYPPDFDPSVSSKRVRKDGPTKLPTIRLMAPFSMKCTRCGEYIYKGRKFNARKENTEQKYYAISIIRFYIRCTRCSGEITFLTDPKNNDYTAEKGIQRNFEPWREAKLAEETEEERLDRMEREEAERDPMKELEKKVHDAKEEMATADRLDEIRTQNARRDRMDQEGLVGRNREPDRDEEKERLDAEDVEAARRAFRTSTGETVRRLAEDEDGDDKAATGSSAAGMTGTADAAAMPAPTFAKAKKRKQDFGAALGLKKKKPLAA